MGMPSKKLPQVPNATTDSVRRLIAELKTHLALGEADTDIADLMGLDADQYRSLKLEMYKREKVELGRTTEEFFIDYRLRQEGVIAELDKMVAYYSPQKVKVEGGGNNETLMADQFSAQRYGGQPSAIVGALRAKSDIIDRIVKVGQEFGILEKAPEKKLVIGGLAVAQMSNEDLRRNIVEAVTGLKKLTTRYGDTDVLGRALPSAGTVPAPVQDAELVPAAPKFTGKGKPKEAVGGRAKAAGAKAVNRQKATAAPAIGG
jgi:hypothetical protein